MTMTARIEKRVEPVRAARIARLVTGIAEAFPELRVEAVAEGVAIAGPGLARRRIDDARLRTIARAEGVKW